MATRGRDAEATSASLNPGTGAAGGQGNVRRRLAAGQACYGIWSLLPGAPTAELLARTGADFVVIDLQHGAAGETELPGVTAAVRAAGSTALVRTRSSHFADVGRPLDLGAQGILVPNVRDAEHVREVVSASRYGPDGTRSIGQLTGDTDNPLLIVVLETATALADLDAIMDVGGLDGIYVGPSDLALSVGLAGSTNQMRMQALVESVVERCIAVGMPVGVHAYDGATSGRFARAGATIVTAAVDTTTLSRAVQASLALARNSMGTTAVS